MCWSPYSQYLRMSLQLETESSKGQLNLKKAIGMGRGPSKKGKSVSMQSKGAGHLWDVERGSEEPTLLISRLWTPSLQHREEINLYCVWPELHVECFSLKMVGARSIADFWGFFFFKYLQRLSHWAPLTWKCKILQNPKFGRLGSAIKKHQKLRAFGFQIFGCTLLWQLL